MDSQDICISSRKCPVERVDAAYALFEEIRISAMDVVDGKDQNPSFAPIFAKTIMYKESTLPVIRTEEEDLAMRIG